MKKVSKVKSKVKAKVKKSVMSHAAASFYHFSQNNSGGRFDYDEEAGITHHVIIEATSVEEANRRAEDIGLYFNGCATGLDCECCGDRWSDKWSEEKGSKFPSLYESEKEEENITKSDYKFSYKWMDAGREACVHYLDGRKVWY